MYYVYYLRLKQFPDKTYIGFTSNLKQRLEAHDSGKSIYTKDYKQFCKKCFGKFIHHYPHKITDIEIVNNNGEKQKG